MLTDALIATVLGLPLSVRLALLDADPTSMGWEIHNAGGELHCTARLRPESDEWRPLDGDDYRSAWLPCNPLAIVEHARDLYGYTSRVRVDQPDYGEWRCSLVVPAPVTRAIRGAKTKTKMDRCPHTAAIALLRDVVGGSCAARSGPSKMAARRAEHANGR